MSSSGHAYIDIGVPMRDVLCYTGEAKTVKFKQFDPNTGKVTVEKDVEYKEMSICGNVIPLPESPWKTDWNKKIEARVDPNLCIREWMKVNGFDTGTLFYCGDVDNYILGIRLEDPNSEYEYDEDDEDDERDHFSSSSYKDQPYEEIPFVEIKSTKKKVKKLFKKIGFKKDPKVYLSCWCS